MQVKFKTETYDCLSVRQSNSNDGANRLSLLLTNVESIDELRKEVTDCEVIEVTDESSVQIYNGYINYVGMSEGENNVEVYLQQDNTLTKLEKLTETVAQQATIIENQAKTIAEQGSLISEQANIIATQGSYIEQLQGETANLNETQAEQDDAINFLLMNDEVVESEE